MPMQKGKSSFSFGKALAQHANDPTEYNQDFSRLPGGISGGVAKLTSAKIGTYKTGAMEGEKFVRLAGVVVEPETVTEVVKQLRLDKGGKPVYLRDANGKQVIKNALPVPVLDSLPPTTTRVAGLQTSVLLPLCGSGSGDKAKTAEDNTAAMLNELRTLGGEEFFSDAAEDASDEEAESYLEQKLESLADAGIYFRFGTNRPDPTVAYPDSRAFERWYGSRGLESYGAGVNGQPETATEDHSGPAAKAPAEALTEEPEAPDPEDYSEAEDLEALVAAANADNTTAQTRLRELASTAGASEQDLDDAADWDAVAALTNAVTEEETPDSEGPWVPEKGNIVFYRFTDPKTKKLAKKAAEVEVLSVDKKTSTVTLKNLDTGKPHIDLKTKKAIAVKWADLEQGA